MRTLNTVRKFEQKRRKKYCMFFTLIELLITIAIIAILAGILLPALKNARERVYAISCANNYKNCHLATMGYANDYNDYFVLQSSSFLYNQLAPYLSQPLYSNGSTPSKPFICPKNYLNPYYSDTTGESAWVVIDLQMWGTSAIRLGSVSNPSRCFMGLELSRRSSGNATVTRYYYYTRNAFAHNGSTNVGHFDGHISTYKDQNPYFFHLDSTATGPNNEAKPYWNPLY